MKTETGTVKKKTNRALLSPAKARKERWQQMIVDLYLKGHSYQQIVLLAAEQTGGHKFTASVISKYVHEAMDGWKTHKDQLIENHKTMELAKVNKLEQEYWAAWERSCNEISTKTSQLKKSELPAKGAEAEEKPKNKKLTLSQQRVDKHKGQGDPRYLAGVQWCIDARCKILGIEVPQVAVQVNNTQNNTNNTTTNIRRVIFKTREMTAAPQVIITKPE